VLSAVLHTIESSNVTRDRHLGRPQVPRNRVIARTLAVIESAQGKALFIDDLCRATEVSERTLRNVFLEYFGVGPMRLLKVRQLLEIRRALLAGDPGQETVARVAARFGVWDFSLFARNYKALYGESPSESLRKPATKSMDTLGLSWVRYAERMFSQLELTDRLAANNERRYDVTNSRE
jgi:AraC-like DNA-binding protein